MTTLNHPKYKQLTMQKRKKKRIERVMSKKIHTHY